MSERIDREADESERSWPPILGLYGSVVVTLAYVRRNRVQEELAETYGVSQSTISRAITAVTPLLALIIHGVRWLTWSVVVGDLHLRC